MGQSRAKPKVKDRFDLQPFVIRRLPIFWIMGPLGTGKETLACMLQKASKFHTVSMKQLISMERSRGKNRAKFIEECLKKQRSVPDEIIITLIKEYIFMNYANAKGFIFCNFPQHLRQAKLFEVDICKVNLIIYCTLVLDALLGRMITKHGDINTEQVRKRFVRSQKESQKIYKYYSEKTIKVMNNYPPQETCTKLISDLEDYWGYKFERLYNKN